MRSSSLLTLETCLWPSQDVEDAFSEQINALENAAWLLNKTPSRNPGAVH